MKNHGLQRDGVHRPFGHCQLFENPQGHAPRSFRQRTFRDQFPNFRIGAVAGSLVAVAPRLRMRPLVMAGGLSMVVLCLVMVVGVGKTVPLVAVSLVLVAGLGFPHIGGAVPPIVGEKHREALSIAPARGRRHHEPRPGNAVPEGLLRADADFRHPQRGQPLPQVFQRDAQLQQRRHGHVPGDSADAVEVEDFHGKPAVPI